MRDRYWDGTAWHDWESLGGELDRDARGLVVGGDRIDVFAPGRMATSAPLVDGVRWVDWERL